ncbi:hypothetical protein [Rhodococcus sp. IEGM 1318]|uniref:hypothetical protein n=1 Tax=Rhodococcus sp. IEGM 1318 TaxID=3082226 RepID=UPI002955888C|nr:hypothetical protein [Rhodococcus sp. IEGM 1318]MDV8008628.1 hypothetical protein [Rhodococcus sp. IEGM 1318]
MNNSRTGRRSATSGRVEVVRPQQDPSLYIVLKAIGHRDDYVVSVNTRPREGRLAGRWLPETRTVKSLREWSAPQDRDVWFSPNPLRARLRPGRRGGIADVARGQTLFADLDVKSGSLASLDECRAVIDLLTVWLEGVPPAVAVESGHGLQPIWRVSNTKSVPNLVTDDGSRWSETSARWSALVNLAVKRVNPNARPDSVFNPDRVLRCPGSVNWKRADEPVAVVTHLHPHFAGGSGPHNGRSLVPMLRPTRLDAVLPPPALGGVAQRHLTRVPTTFREAQQWLANQPGATVTWKNMDTAMQRLCDYRALVQMFAHGLDDDVSAHSLMVRRVLAVILTSTDGSAGVVRALELVRTAYLEVMGRRRLGELPGEGRGEGAAESDFYRAVVGAVSKARGRIQSPTPRVGPDGRVVLFSEKGRN